MKLWATIDSVFVGVKFNMASRQFQILITKFQTSHLV